MTTLFWIFLLLAICSSAFFSGIEIAFVSANKLKIELDNNQGHFTAKLLSSFLKKPAKFIGAMLLGNNIALVIYSILMAFLIASVLFVELHLTELWSSLSLNYVREPGWCCSARRVKRRRTDRPSARRDHALFYGA